MTATETPMPGSLHPMVREILPVESGERADRGTCPESAESGISKPWPLPVGVITARGYFLNDPSSTQDSMKTEQTSKQPTPAPLAGLKYMLNHSRFGRATVKVLHVDETWADCEVLSGTMRGIGRGAVWGPGDTKTVRIEHGVWTLVPNDPSSPTAAGGNGGAERKR